MESAEPVLKHWLDSYNTLDQAKMGCGTGFVGNPVISQVYDPSHHFMFKYSM